ncbi:MAG: hypothetical protein A2X25_05370 [Chloroflexi bacterium GWB2_49_20]|nr:MAG: hypothetical protein A2X25_05370 [Chloroflexi bacterium GWB2_49_20]OGN77056.1 MAG: hypothetical protein A2X26_06370 [Chloroflexi bacterium GWC2_49_37]OGN83782.1 MAG: hypothetical protein A2X27_01970 [Chloroflexi bacterium GWD2_49_16]HCM96859.1 hypothetical protein [Anaerolineae bacterium]
MKKQEQQEYMEKYKKAKAEGVPFFPDIIFKDIVVSLLILIILVLLAYFIGAPVEARANPNDASYTPRPEWYFLFLFQMLKYFPGKLEVVGAMILPTLFIGLLLVLPFLDKSPKRHFLKRPFASLMAVGVLLGIVGLTLLALNAAPTPQTTVVIDKAADLYAKNCANCHGPTIDVPAGVDLHQIIAAGNHQGMPAWGGDLSTDEIDMLVGFILSPNGSALFTRECAGCHKNAIQATGNPIELQRVFDEGKAYPAHKDQDVTDWKKSLNVDEQNALLNFLAAPDGQRLFVINCSGCHGEGIAFKGSKEELRKLIVDGGHQLTMPGWKGTLSTDDLDTLANYVTDPQGYPAGTKLFGIYCATCHGDKVPVAPDKESALTMIGSGGAHITMPVWGDILTSDQVDALVAYTLESGSETGIIVGAKLFAENCTFCHGKYGEGGLNPTFAGDTIAPISSPNYLKTRDDTTIRNIIAEGQTFGMPPFASSYGGTLNDDQIAALVAFIRNWEIIPPIIPDIPATPTANPTATPGTTSPGSGEVSFADQVQPIFQSRCIACHNSSSGQAGFDASTYQAVMTSGDSGPQIVAGDAANSPLITLLQTATGFMPPMGKLSDDDIQIIVEWINAGALDN